MIIQARLHRAHMLAKAQHDAELFGLDAEKSGQSPDRQGADQNQRDTQAAEIAARQQLLQPVLSAAQKVFEIGRPWPDRLRSRAPRPFRTRAPGTSALILPRHRQSPLRAQVRVFRARRPASQYSQHLDGFIGDRPGPYNASFLLERAMLEPIIVNVNIAERS